MPGDVVLIEAGDLVPADARIVTSASLEVQEASLTGESAPIAKDATTLPDGRDGARRPDEPRLPEHPGDPGLGDVVVVATGASTQMGHIADMVTATKRTKSPLQRELDGLTKLFGILAWAAVAVIAIFGIARGQDAETLVLLCVSTAISAIPTGLPTFVQLMLSSGAQRLAEAKAVVKSLTDVETLGGTTVINSDKTGTLTMNAMTATTMLAGGDWYKIEGGGYKKSGAILGVGGRADAATSPGSALGLVLCSDATVADDESIIGDPTEAALVVLAAKIGVDAEETRARPAPHGRRCRSTPSTSSWRRSTTAPTWIAGGVLHEPHFISVKGAPDVVIDRCATGAVARRAGPDRAGPRRAARRQPAAVRARAARARVRRPRPSGRRHDGRARRPDGRGARPRAGLARRASSTRCAPRPSTPSASPTRPGIDVRMITGDHTVTARAIADELGLGPGVITGTELSHLSDDEVIAQLPQLHVFGRVAPEDKVRLARLMQEAGEVVAMTGDAVNDAAALKQADVGVAMGSGSEVTKQAGKLVLTDDNFATLVHAVDLGRDIYRRISSYVKLQLTILSSVLQLMLFATILNINGGVALFPMQLLFAKFFVVVTVVDRVHRRRARPRRHAATAAHTRHRGSPPGAQTVRWAITGFIIASLALMVLAWGPDDAEHDRPVGVDDDGLRRRRAQRRQQRPRACAASASRGGRHRSSPTSGGSSSGGSSPGPRSS